jgi:hypothetical protein
VLRAAGAPSLPVALLILRDVCRGLEAAHAVDIVHRDIKPANLMLTTQGIVKVMDFGLARQTEEGTTITVQGSVMGSAAYMSPEQAQGKNVDHRTDIYSTGLVGYEILSGTRAFPGESYAMVLHDVIYKDPEPLSQRKPDLPEAVTSLIGEMIEKDLTQRCPTMSQARDRLESIAESMGLHRADTLLADFLRETRGKLGDSRSTVIGSSKPPEGAAAPTMLASEPPTSIAPSGSASGERSNAGTGSFDEAAPPTMLAGVGPPPPSTAEDETRPARSRTEPDAGQSRTVLAGSSVSGPGAPVQSMPGAGAASAPGDATVGAIGAATTGGGTGSATVGAPGAASEEGAWAFPDSAGEGRQRAGGLGKRLTSWKTLAGLAGAVVVLVVAFVVWKSHAPGIESGRGTAGLETPQERPGGSDETRPSGDQTAGSTAQQDQSAAPGSDQSGSPSDRGGSAEPQTGSPGSEGSTASNEAAGPGPGSAGSRTETTGAGPGNEAPRHETTPPAQGDQDQAAATPGGGTGQSSTAHETSTSLDQAAGRSPSDSNRNSGPFKKSYRISTRPWALVYVDNDPTPRNQTFSFSIMLEQGLHLFRLVNENAHLDTVMTYEVEPGDRNNILIFDLVEKRVNAREE